MIEDLAGEFTDVDDFDEFISQTKTWVEASFNDFEDEDDDLPAVAIFQDGLGRVAMCPITEYMVSDEMKNAVAEILPKVAEMTNACRYVFASSAWAVEASSPEELEENQAKYPSLKDHPGRKEVVQIFCGEWTGDAAFLTAEIIRHQGAPPTLLEWKEGRLNWLNQSDTGAGGRFSDPVMRQLTGIHALTSTIVDSVTSDDELRDKFWGVLKQVAAERGVDDPNEMVYPESGSDEQRALFDRITELMEQQYPGEMEEVRRRLREAVTRTRSNGKEKDDATGNV